MIGKAHELDLLAPANAKGSDGNALGVHATAPSSLGNRRTKKPQTSWIVKQNRFLRWNAAVDLKGRAKHSLHDLVIACAINF